MAQLEQPIVADQTAMTQERFTIPSTEVVAKTSMSPVPEAVVNPITSIQTGMENTTVMETGTIYIPEMEVTSVTAETRQEPIQQVIRDEISHAQATLAALHQAQVPDAKQIVIAATQQSLEMNLGVKPAQTMQVSIKEGVVVIVGLNGEVPPLAYDGGGGGGIPPENGDGGGGGDDGNASKPEHRTQTERGILLVDYETNIARCRYIAHRYQMLCDELGSFVTGRQLVSRLVKNGYLPAVLTSELKRGPLALAERNMVPQGSDGTWGYMMRALAEIGSITNKAHLMQILIYLTTIYTAVAVGGANAHGLQTTQEAAQLVLADVPDHRV